MITDFEGAVLDALTWAAMGWAAWCVVALGIAVVDRRLAARLAPPILKGLLVAGLAAATAVPARAADTGASALDGLQLPDRPTTAATTTSPGPSTHGPARPTPRQIVVEPGDCLWNLVRERLPDTASDARVAAEVARWHAANRSTIGPDPDVLIPGQTLTAPGAP